MYIKPSLARSVKIDKSSVAQNLIQTMDLKINYIDQATTTVKIRLDEYEKICMLADVLFETAWPKAHRSQLHLRSRC